MIPDLVTLTLYCGYILLIVGALGVIFGPGADDPFKRFLNMEVPALGTSLILLSYNHTLALMTFLMVNTLVMIVVVRAIIKNKEIGN